MDLAPWEGVRENTVDDTQILARERTRPDWVKCYNCRLGPNCNLYATYKSLAGPDK
ncbi:MAG: hypothetical protein JRM95_03860 [Nitrososphaerota archaeon]|nr:hypothetical protein [Nitrososphaerota archaeon]